MMEGRSAMNIEIHKPELERRVLDGIQSGRFHDVDELLTKALDALSEKEASRPYSGAALVADRTAVLDWSSDVCSSDLCWTESRAAVFTTLTSFLRKRSMLSPKRRHPVPIPAPPWSQIGPPFSTGVQTCALPICAGRNPERPFSRR